MKVKLNRQDTATVLAALRLLQRTVLPVELIDIATDGGAYSTLSSTVLSRATLHSTGPYLCPHVRVRSHAWATNTVPYGAFRGFGAPQAVFAIERHMDQIAAAIGIDPIELRRRNFLHDGDMTATEQVMREPVILDHLLDG